MPSFVRMLECIKEQYHLFPVGCNKGSYLQKDECLKCPQGTYQDQEYQINCTRCPVGTSTAENGSTSLSDCTGKFINVVQDMYRIYNGNKIFGMTLVKPISLYS